MDKILFYGKGGNVVLGGRINRSIVFKVITILLVELMLFAGIGLC